MKQLIISIVFLLFIPVLFAQTPAIGSPPVVSNVEMEQIGGKVYVTFNLHIETNPVPCHVNLVISGDEGVTFNIYASPDYLEGNYIENVTDEPQSQTIIWNVYQQAQNLGTLNILGETSYRARVIARRIDPDPDHPSAPAGFIFVQGTAGVTFSPGGEGYFTPGGTYHVSLSDFYLSRHEVTQAEYFAVMGSLPDQTPGVGDLHPVSRVSWFNAIEYCNRLSMMEGLTPAYSYDDGIDYGTNPDDWPSGWNTTDANHPNVSCNWSANGYRLPTEMEREYAARGGVPAQNAGTFNDLYAGTNVDGTEPGQLGDYAWYSANNTPSGTKPVGTKLPNELGLYDMSGNVWNWVWDISGSYPSGSFTDPTGSVSGSYRVTRGGSWFSGAGYCPVAFRYLGDPAGTNVDLGFRVCRNVSLDTVAAPIIHPPGGLYQEPQTVTITCNTDGALIFYTDDQSEPTESSMLYQEPITISQNTVIKAKAFKQGWIPSETVSEEYIFMPEGFVFVQGTAGVTFSPGGFEYFNPGASGGGSYNVSLSDFYLARHEVTQAEYFAVMGSLPDQTPGVGDLHPVSNVSWFNAIEYCNRLSMMEGLTPAYSYDDGVAYGTDPDNWPSGWKTSSANHANVFCNWSADGYRLPTEMEREYAARGGVPAATAIPSTFNDLYAGTNVVGTGPGQLGDYAWYTANNSPSGTKPVGTKLPNELGLYDMSGNVFNWVWDRHGSYPSGSFTNPTGYVIGSERVVRGGSWYHHADFCRVTNRSAVLPAGANARVGFRVCRNSP